MRKKKKTGWVKTGKGRRAEEDEEEEEEEVGEEEIFEYWGEEERVKDDNEEKWWRRRNSIQREKSVTNIALISSSVFEHTAEMWLYISCLLFLHQSHNHTQSLKLLGLIFCLCLVFLTDFTELERTLMTVEGYLYTFLNNSQLDAFRIRQTITLLFSSCQNLLLRASGGVLGIIQQHTYTLKPSSIFLLDCKLPSVLSHSQRRHEG